MRRVVLVLLMLGALVVPGSAQIFGTGVLPTIEVGPLAQTSLVTSLQSTISAVQSVLQTGYMLLEITPLDDIALSAEFLETMATLGEIAHEGQALMQDAQAAAALFDTLFGIEGEPPRTPQALQQRVNDTALYIIEARRYAVRTQSLINHIAGAVSHVTRIVELVGILTGNMQGNQLLVQLQAQANQTLATQTLQSAAHQRIQVFEGAQREIIVRGWNRMQYDRWEGWPTTAEGLN